MGKIITISLWGRTKSDMWEAWYDEAKSFGRAIGADITHIGVTGTGYASSKIMTVKRKEKEVIDRIRRGEEILGISLYSLPNDYKIAAFDYDLSFWITNAFIAVSMNEKYYDSDIEERFLSKMVKYIDLESGEVFSTSDDESPYIYSATRDIDNLNTYEFIKNIGRT